LSFALHEFLRGFLSLGNALLDVSIRLALGLLKAPAPTLTDLFDSLGACLGLLCSFSRSVLSFPRAFRGVSRSPDPNIHGVTADRSRIDHGRLNLSPLITHNRGRRTGRFLDRVYGAQSSRQ
jgi:hypothetical protein